jgi:hypothetical protein
LPKNTLGLEPSGIRFVAKLGHVNNRPNTRCNLATSTSKASIILMEFIDERSLLVCWSSILGAQFVLITVLVWVSKAEF